MNIALERYNLERKRVPALPKIDAIPDLTPFAEFGLGVAAFHGDEMVGFLCSVPAFPNVFRSTDAIGVFSPMHANGATGINRALIYDLMYQAAGKRWAAAGASSHAICLYAHDREVQERLFLRGFGLRCLDAIRLAEGLSLSPVSGFEFCELSPDELPSILSLNHKLDEHMASSPTFILRPSDSIEAFCEKAEQSHARFFAAKTEGETVAFIKAEQDGETFICSLPGYLHITGAYCLPEYRGTGVYQNLLDFLIGILKTEGYALLGVDFESINPTAYGFWLKYFDAYTHSVTRRIDEHAIQKS
ncbi:MAG: GNAT family N-acetyltransferase [Clostridiales bacterium]|nr:GNAT family N-acetyltransferase [Clostridiales bacterium]